MIRPSWTSLATSHARACVILTHSMEAKRKALEGVIKEARARYARPRDHGGISSRPLTGRCTRRSLRRLAATEQPRGGGSIPFLAMFPSLASAFKNLSLVPFHSNSRRAELCTGAKSGLEYAMGPLLERGPARMMHGIHSVRHDRSPGCRTTHSGEQPSVHHNSAIQCEIQSPER